MSQTLPSRRPALDPDDATQPVGADSPYSCLRPPEADDEIGRLGNFRVLRLLAEGGMGSVFLAEDIALHRKAALKVIRPNLERILPGAVERFLREARAMAGIKHDNLVTVYAAGEDEGVVYLAMELLQGETLEARLERTWPLPAAEVVRIGKETAAGLGAVHEAGLIHRDIKPANLWIEAPSGRVKILDFGLVRTARGEGGLTQVGMVVGTPAYLSPEQVRAEPYDHRADLFSLGCVLYRMCTNQVPFPAATPTAQLTAVAVDEATPIRILNPAIPDDLSALVTRLLDKDPDDRPQSALEVIERLVKVKRGLSGVRRRAAAETARNSKTHRTRKAAPPAEARDRRWMRWAWAAVVASIVVPLSVAGVVAYQRSHQPTDSEQLSTPPPAPLEKKYLDELTPAETVNWPFRGPLPPGLTGRLRVHGQPVPHAVFMHAHPPFEPAPSISYALGGKYARFSGAVGYADSAPPEAPPLAFAVYADDRPDPVWQSREPLPRNQTEAFDIPVTGVKVLRIETRSWGDPRGGHGAWVDPVLTK